MKYDTLNDEAKNQLLSTPHQIFLADGILKLTVTGFKSELTLANTSPNGQPQPSVTISIATNDLYDIAKQITTEIESKKKQIDQQHAELSGKLK